MRALSAALSFACSFAAARLSLTDTMKAVKSGVCTARDGKAVYINPEGPLNILRAHALVGNNIIANKRLFLGPGTVVYRLVRDEANDTYEYEKPPAEGPIRDFPGVDPKAMAYLRAYHETLRIMFRAVDRTVYVSNNYHKSFYKYLSVLPDDDSRAHFLAMLLVLAEVGPEAIKATVHREKAKRLNRRPSCIDFTCRKSGCVLLSSPLTAPGKNWRLGYSKNALAVVDFFATHGGADVPKAYGLEHYSDSPGSLILAYIYEFASDHEFIGRVFGHVDAILRQAYAGDELAAVHARFFASGSEIGPEHSRAYDALEKIGEIDSRCVFPFSRANPPLFHQLVYLYDEAAQSVCSETSYSDCAEIALYNLFCCLLFDPKTREYTTAHLKRKGCNPTERFRAFFAEKCPEPSDNTKPGMHQEWACVAQNLALSLKGSNNVGAGAEGDNLIAYKKGSVESARVELKGNLVNFMMALAKIAGLPEETTRELQGHLSSSAATGSVDHDDCNRISDAIAEALNCISLMHVDARVLKLSAEGTILCGTLELSFQLQESDTDAPSQTVELGFAYDHVSFVHSSSDVMLSTEERKFFRAYAGAGDGGSNSLFTGLIVESVRRFLSKADGSLLPNACISKVEAAGGSIAYHNALADWMARVELLSPDCLLTTVDQLTPALAAFVQRNMPLFSQIRTLREQLNEPSSDPSSKALIESQLTDAQDRVAGSPLVILVANILGRAPLTDDHTREPLFEVLMRQHVDERAFLFPQLRIPQNAYPQISKAESLNGWAHGINILSRHEVPNTLAGYLNLRAVAGSEPIDPERRYPRTVEYFQKFVSCPYPDHHVLITLVKYCDESILTIMRENYIFSTCEVGSEHYCLLAANWVAIAAAAGRYEEIRRVCDEWKDAECSPSDGNALKFLRDEGRHRTLSTLIVDRVFPNGPESRQLRALLRSYAFFACDDGIYDGIYEVFAVYRDSLDLSFAVGYCEALISSYSEIYAHMKSFNTSRWAYFSYPIDPLYIFMAKLKFLYLQDVAFRSVHVNAFTGVERQLRVVSAYLKGILDGFLYEDESDDLC
ncbi:hypothetical protein PAPHI01_2355 [Pancytospora philotis]|nr:hypothetical protein PAPHI01_2355 [Pancytospora philotis]